MGSCCIVKTCNSKRNKRLGIKTSFHRLSHRTQNLCVPINKIFGANNVRDITQWSRICTEHIKVLEQFTNSEVESSKTVKDDASNLQDKFRRLRDLIVLAKIFKSNGLCEITENMIADATRENMTNEMDVASTSDSSKNSDGSKEEEDPLRHPEPNPEPAPTNGQVSHEEATHKEEDDGHVTSEDEDKLIINENCEKKETIKQDANSTAPAESMSPAFQIEVREPSPKGSLKRPVEDAEIPENSYKKPRVMDDSDPNMGHLDESLAILKAELQGIEILLLQKEEEWNSLLRVQKKKEEQYLRLHRKRQVIAIKKDEKREESADDDEDSSSYFPQHLRSLSSPQFPLLMMKHMLGENYMPQISPSNRSSNTKDSSSINGPLPPQNTISVIDIHTNNCKPIPTEAPQVSISPDAHNKLGRHLNSIMSMKPILPKPINCVGIMPSPGGTPPPLSYPLTGYGPQGPTVSVHHLIAAHRKDNPNIPPIRGAKRGAWRNRYEGDKRGSPREHDRPSSVSSSNSDADLRLSLNSKINLSNSLNNNNSLLAMNDPSVSYKDVLLQFAQLTQQEKQAGSPQISIIPVSGGETPSRKFEHTPDSTSVSRELSVPSQSSIQSPNLESSSALAKLLLESGGSHGSVSKSAAVDLSSYNSSPHSLTLSALLSGGTTTTLKEKPTSALQGENRPKKPSQEEGNSNPKCQGCHSQRAQFVCAGCSNQWYCSRGCQINAWDKHSENCNS